jgi:phenylacetate-CoA ligase
MRVSERYWRQIYYPLMQRKLRLSFWDFAQHHIASQWQSPEEIEQAQLAKLRLLLAHATENVPYYKRTLGALGIHPEGIQSFSDLRKLPFLTRDIIKAEFPAGMKAKNVSEARFASNRTSGTAGGIPIEFFNDGHPKVTAQILASRLALYDLSGFSLGAKTFYFTGRPNDLSPWRERQVGFERVTHRDIFSLFKEISEFKPQIIGGYPTALVSLVEYLRAAHLRLPGDLDAIVSTGAAMTPAQSNYLTEFFHCPVFQRYGSTEFSGYVAQECSIKSGYHVNPELVILEVLKDGQPVKIGERGELVITDLHNYAMPLIRYKISDLATLLPQCSCGRGSRLIQDIDGRTSLFLVTQRGLLFPLAGVSDILKTSLFLHEILYYQYVQSVPGEVLLKVVLLRESRSLVEQIRKTLTPMLDDIELQIELVNEIPLDPSGKRARLKQLIPKEKYPLL